MKDYSIIAFFQSYKEGKCNANEYFEGILIPFVGTTLGAACVFFMRKTLRLK